MPSRAPSVDSVARQPAMFETSAPIDIVFREETLWRAISFHASLPSTNERLVQLPASEPEGIVVVADATEGHGRWARKGDSRGRTLLTSFLVRFSTQRAVLAGAAAGLALLDACQTILPSCEMHWPYGLFAGGKALGGVRIDLAHDMLAFGFGLDVDTRGLEPAVPNSTSLAAELGADVSRWALLGELMIALDRSVRRAREDSGALLEEYRARCASIGRVVTVQTAGGDRVVGRGVGIDHDGQLELEVEGKPRKLVGGEVIAVEA